jgi:hypothetical protein
MYHTNAIERMQKAPHRKKTREPKSTDPVEVSEVSTKYGVPYAMPKFRIQFDAVETDMDLARTFRG